MLKLKNYLNINKLYINTKKTYYISFNSPPINITYNSIAIDQSDHIKLLGWTLDKLFKFNVHISKLIGNLNKAISILHRFRYFPINVRKSLFFAFIDSHIKFSSPILINITKGSIKSIKCKYKKALTLLNLGDCTQLTDFDMNICTSVCKFIHQIFRHQSPAYPLQLFSPYKSKRHKPIFLLPTKPRRSLCFLYDMLYCWNNMQPLLSITFI